jgi:polysaccharide pyruvyl transferase WcaK-like protein
VSEIISGSDIIFSIGGDIYTVPQEILNNKTKIAYSRLVQVGEKIINNNVPIIIYGASIGPFGSNLKNIEYFRKHLEKASLIVCREFKTINYLKSLGLDRSLEFMPDPAYYVKTDKAKNVPKKRIIAFNISEFSIKEHINDIDEYIEQLIYELYRIASDKDYTILFVPHVVPSKNTVDNDLAFLLKIFSKIPIHMKNRFDIIDKKLGFIETKKILKQCDVLVASRMHCAINAISENIPTILLSYSEKSIGMAEFIYNNTNWVIPMNDLNERIYNTISNLLLNKDGAEKDIRRRLNEIYESPLYKQVEEKIADLFREISNE